MYDDEYNEEEDEVFSREGGIFQIDTPDLREVRRFRENVRKSNKFNIIKLNERREKMENEFGDSAYNDNEDLKELAEDFLDEEIGGDFEKNLVLLPEKFKTALEEAYRNLIAYRSELEQIPELLEAVKLMARIATGKPSLPSKYPYPKKVEKSMSWGQVQDMLFGGRIGPGDDEEIEKSSKSNPFPSIVRAIKIQEEVLDELDDELEQDIFDPDDRVI